MINPCKECLVQVNCTQVCPGKTNFQVWLRNAIKQYQYGRLATTPQLKKMFMLYKSLETENLTDINNIKRRKHRVEKPELYSNSNI